MSVLQGNRVPAGRLGGVIKEVLVVGELGGAESARGAADDNSHTIPTKYV